MRDTDRRERVRRAWQQLATAGARRTLARGMVIDALAGTSAHLSITAIHQKVAEQRPEINISTVHRTVAFLAEHAVVHQLAWPGEARYGLCADPHVHAICEECGTISEIPAPSLAHAVAAAGDATRYDIGQAGLTLFGRCPACR
ncbi:Fur family transcriptional regulator [Rugosimonospora africana]|nr:transcriptional repressor [Rugosimonospora africana]